MMPKDMIALIKVSSRIRLLLKECAVRLSTNEVPIITNLQRRDDIPKLILSQVRETAEMLISIKEEDKTGCCLLSQLQPQMTDENGSSKQRSNGPVSWQPNLKELQS